MNVGWNIETYISISTLILSVIGTIILLRVNWKQYGLLFLISAVTGVVLCYIFIGLGLYKFPHGYFPKYQKYPLLQF
jgi:hypothetical protein